MPYTFIDPAECNRQFPISFEKPAELDIAALTVGDYVKIGVEFEHSDQPLRGERFWVRIVTVDPANNAIVQARVVNDLTRTDKHGLEFGSTISFERRFALDIIQGELASSTLH